MEKWACFAMYNGKGGAFPDIEFKDYSDELMHSASQ